MHIINRPLITFALLAYNQESFVREAVEGAFSQTYYPLQIILSDDCSTDRTFQIMRDLASAYRGQHSIVLNRSPVNLGIGPHINHVVQMAHGDLIVAAAGDDVSLPHRTQRLFDVWESSERRVTSIFGAFLKIDRDGKALEVVQKPQPDLKDLRVRVRSWNVAPGCSHAFAKSVFGIFGPLNRDVVAEDATINFRSWALHPPAYLEEPLVRYRLHEGNISRNRGARFDIRHRRSQYVRLLLTRYSIFKQYLTDMDNPIFENNCSKSDLLFARQHAINEMAEFLFHARFASASRKQRLSLLSEYLQHLPKPKRVCSWLLRLSFSGVDEWHIRRLSKGL
jgi:glycosyltransferase involved in cell wall biosynthesis